jgi:hypothetical protein
MFIGVAVLLVMGTGSFAAERKLAEQFQAPEVESMLAERALPPASDPTAPKPELFELEEPQPEASLTFQPPEICVAPSPAESPSAEELGDSR